MIGYAEKCKMCPYKLGIVKCIVSSCPKCMVSKSRTNPFLKKEEKNNSTISSLFNKKK